MGFNSVKSFDDIINVCMYVLLLKDGEKVGRDDLSLYNLINGIDCVPHDEWVASSNGAWYVVFPLSPDLCSNR